jgi:hypothetical protein
VPAAKVRKVDVPDGRREEASNRDLVTGENTRRDLALLSGTPKRDNAADAKGGLLRAIGDSGILTLKDFGSILSMHRDARAGVLAALRELYDGSWTRHVGTDGGRTLSWQGKLTLLAGCTPAIDQHHVVTAALGERFCMYRLAVEDPDEQAKRSLAHSRKQREMRQELRAAVSSLFASLDFTVPELDPQEIRRLVALSTLVLRCRSSVIRDPYGSREIELVPDAEAPGRLVGTLERILGGLRVIGLEDEEAWRVLVKTGLDSMPKLRRVALEYLIEREDEETKTTEFAEAADLPTSTALRVLQDLNAHKVIKRISGGGPPKPDIWRVSPEMVQQYRSVYSPEMSEDLCLISPNSALDDFSGE